MTCIVGLIDNNTIYLGSDSCISSSAFKFYTPSYTKVFLRQNILFGISGDVRYNDIIKYRLSVPYHREDKTNIEYLCTDFIDSLRQALEKAKYSLEEDAVASVPYKSTLLLGYRNKLYCIFYDYSVLEFSDFYSIGSGSDFVLGSLETTKNLGFDPKKRIELALEAACKFSVGCALPFNIIEQETLQ